MIKTAMLITSIIGVIVSFYMIGATTVNSNLIDDVAINKAIEQCKNNGDSSLLLKEIELIKIKHYKEKNKVSKYGIYFGIFLIHLMTAIIIKS